jgi:hypothetical protein
MAEKYSLEDYETVDSRLRRLYANYPEARVLTEMVYRDDRSFIVKAELYLDRNDMTPVATGYAEEIVGAGFVNKTSALENCETSAIGRSISNSPLVLGTPEGKRPSQTEMEKVERVSFTVSEVKGADTLGTSLELIKDKLGATELPEAPICNHGHMIHRSGKAKATGKEWQGYMCTEKVKDKQCDPVWLKQTATGSWYVPKPELADHL